MPHKLSLQFLSSSQKSMTLPIQPSTKKHGKNSRKQMLLDWVRFLPCASTTRRLHLDHAPGYPSLDPNGGKARPLAELRTLGQVKPSDPLRGFWNRLLPMGFSGALSFLVGGKNLCKFVAFVEGSEKTWMYKSGVITRSAVLFPLSSNISCANMSSCNLTKYTRRVCFRGKAVPFLWLKNYWNQATKDTKAETST